MASAAPAASEPTYPPNPFADKPAPSPINPYASPPAYGKPTLPELATGNREAALAKVRAPAIGMMVYGVLALILVVGNLAIGFVTGFENVSFGPPPENDAERAGQVVGVFVGAVVAAALMSSLLFGAWKMMRLENYGWAMAASILSMLPCSLCCVLGLPFGIWGIVTLNDPLVKSHFH